MSEIWKPVVGYEDYYQVSSLGRIKSLRRPEVRNDRILKGSIHPEGYNIFKLSRSGSHKSFKGHRLVAKAFIPNPENKPQVNHKNGLRADNRVENLEWVTNSENVRHGYRVLGSSHKKIPYKLGKLKGVCFHKATQKYISKISWDGREVHLGLYECKQVAYLVYYDIHVKLHGKEPFDPHIIPVGN